MSARQSDTARETYRDRRAAERERQTARKRARALKYAHTAPVPVIY